jgi:hypothetical protein
LQVCRDALEQDRALFRRQRRGRGHDHVELLIGERNHRAEPFALAARSLFHG